MCEWEKRNLLIVATCIKSIAYIAPGWYHHSNDFIPVPLVDKAAKILLNSPCITENPAGGQNYRLLEHATTVERLGECALIHVLQLTPHGQATAEFLGDLVRKNEIEVSRLARGLPMGCAKDVLLVETTRGPKRSIGTTTKATSISNRFFIRSLPRNLVLVQNIFVQA